MVHQVSFWLDADAGTGQVSYGVEVATGSIMLGTIENGAQESGRFTPEIASLCDKFIHDLHKIRESNTPF